MALGDMSEGLWRAVAAAVGIAFGAVLASTAGKKERDDLKKEVAAEKLRSQALATRLKECAERAKDPAQLLIAMTAVGVAVANADGEIADSERDEIERFVAGVLASTFPQSVKDLIGSIYSSPPPFREALSQYVAPIMDEPYFDWMLIDEVIAIVTDADGMVHPSEKSLRCVLAEFREHFGR